MFSITVKANEMIISYKESNTEKEFREKPMKGDHPKRHHTYMYIYWHEYSPIFVHFDGESR